MHEYVGLVLDARMIPMPSASAVASQPLSHRSLTTGRCGPEFVSSTLISQNTVRSIRSFNNAMPIFGFEPRSGDSPLKSSVEHRRSASSRTDCTVSTHARTVLAAKGHVVNSVTHASHETPCQRAGSCSSGPATPVTLSPTIRSGAPFALPQPWRRAAAALTRVLRARRAGRTSRPTRSSRRRRETIVTRPHLTRRLAMSPP